MSKFQLVLYTSKNFNYESFIEQLKPKKAYVYDSQTAVKYFVHLSIFTPDLSYTPAKCLEIAKSYEDDQYISKIICKSVKSLKREYAQLQDTQGELSCLFNLDEIKKTKEKLITVPKSQSYPTIYKRIATMDKIEQLIDANSPDHDLIMKDLSHFKSYYDIVHTS